MKYTENLNLKKPESTDFYDVDDFNDNMDTIEREFEKRPTDDGDASSMTAKFSETSTLETIMSGEKISTAFGKIAKAITDFISHITTKASTTVLGHVKLTDSSAVTDGTGYALPATEKNASISGTLANLIAQKLSLNGGTMNGGIEMGNNNIGSVGNIWLNPYADWLTNILNNKLPVSASCNKNWNWSGQGGTPMWVWGGGDDGYTNCYVYSPGNFSVNHSNTARWLKANGTGRILAITDDDYLRTYSDVSAGNGNGDNGVVSVGSPNYRMKQVYVSASSISTSDKNLKDNIKPLTDKHLEFFMLLTPVSFAFKDGTSGRTHVGFISQDVEEAMTKCGFTDLDFAGFCKDKKVRSYLVKDEKTKKVTEVTEEVLDEDGNPIFIYSLRYEEFIGLIAHSLQRTISEVDALKEDMALLKDAVGI